VKQKIKTLNKMESDLAKNLEILVGTYEEYVIGYRMCKQEDGEFSLEQSFTSRAHSGPVRSLAALSKFCISGGSDELCKVFDMSARVEGGTLMHHEGTVSCLASHEQHLVSASDDNSLCVLRAGSWQLEKSLYKHSAGITALALHPTGKLAFSAGKDRKLITWNLVKARPAFITNLKGIAEFITVSPDGTRFAVGLHRRVDIYSLESAGVEYTINLKTRPNCLVFLDQGSLVVVGGESPEVGVHSLIEKERLKGWEAHKTRVRCMALLSDTKLVTASSCDGEVKVWNIAADGTTPVSLCCSVNTQCRITCLTTWWPAMKEQARKAKKRKKVTESEEKVKERNVEKEDEESSSSEEEKSEEVVKKKVKLPAAKPVASKASSNIQLIEEEEDSVSKPKEKVKKKNKKPHASSSEPSVG